LHQVAQHLKLDTLTLFGHCAGGVAALEFAAAYPELVGRVVLLATGAPLRHQAQWDAMPPSASRTFFLSQHAPELLATPHKLVAANFASGPEGRQQTVTYFYDGQGDDLRLLEDPARHAWACAMLGYCLADTAQLIRDVQFWASDWSALALNVAERCPIAFIQGDANQQFPLADVQAFCAQHSNLQATAAAGAAQLTLLTHGELVVQVLRSQSAYCK
jgi:pimeloyl-ACP methyl ester carboxylesterase